MNYLREKYENPLGILISNGQFLCDLINFSSSVLISTQAWCYLNLPTVFDYTTHVLIELSTLQYKFAKRTSQYYIAQLLKVNRDG